MSSSVASHRFSSTSTTTSKDDIKPKQRDRDLKNFAALPSSPLLVPDRDLPAGMHTTYYVDLTGQRVSHISVWNDIDLCGSYRQMLFNLQQESPVSEEVDEPKAKCNFTGGERDGREPE